MDDLAARHQLFERTLEQNIRTHMELLTASHEIRLDSDALRAVFRKVFERAMERAIREPKRCDQA